MRALVTGATGFLGSYLTATLVRNGVETAVLMREGSNPWRITELLPSVTVIQGDLEELNPATDRIGAFAPDTVFHLAWFGVQNRYRNAEEQVDRNLSATLSLLRAARDAGCTTFIGVGSQAEYGPSPDIVKVDTPTRPTTLYGVTKLCASLLCGQLAAQYGLRFAWMRLFSSYGPKDNPDWMIPYLIRSLLACERPALTAGEQLWDYIYVTDAAEALYRVAMAPQAHGVFNLGSGEAHRLRDIVEQIRDLIDPTLPLGFGEVPYRPDQVKHLQADVSELTAQAGWRPQVSLSEGLKQTVEWHKQSSAARVTMVERAS
jgi:nucleoside-diphosphate-sugar epimerase